LEYQNTERLFKDKNTIVSQNEVYLFEAKKEKAKAKMELARANLNFASIKAPFDGIIDRLKEMQGSLIKEGDTLTTLSDNSVMWVYFNVPEKQYLEYMAEVGQNRESPDIELVLANLTKFPTLGQIDPARNKGAIEADFNNETGNIRFRADFENPIGPAGQRLLRHGQTGTVLINRPLKNALIIPQRATFENLAKRYVYIVDKDDVVHQREIAVQYELEDIYVIKDEVDVNDRIVLEGIRQVHDGEKERFEFLPPDQVIANQKNHAE
jgi:membrane fusion protein (multidrug efflux system)